MFSESFIAFVISRQPPDDYFPHYFEAAESRDHQKYQSSSF